MVGGIGIEGEGIVWGAGAFAASLLVGVALVPFRASIGLENVAVVYLAVVILASAVGGRAAGLVAALSAALAYNWFFTTPYYTLRIDSVSQVVTVVLLFAAGLLASLGGRANRQVGARAREEADTIRALHAISRAAASGSSPERVAAELLLELLDARAVQVMRDNGQRDRLVAAAGEPVELDLAALPHLDEEGRIPSGHLRSVGGTLVLPAEGAVVDMVRGQIRVGALVVVPRPDRPILRSTRMAIAAAANALATC